MRTFWLIAVAVAATSLLILGADWPTQGGSPQRSGWARSERLIDKSNVSALKLLYKYQADNVSSGANSLTSPIIDGNLITYRGFKEMLLFGASSDRVFSVDADLNKRLWVARLRNAGDKPPQSPTLACSGGLTAPVVMAGSSSASLHFAADASRMSAALGAKRKRPSPYFPPLDRSLYPLTPETLTQLAALYAVSSDGNLHVLNSSTGKDLLPPVKFLPPDAKVTSLNVWENVIYATTANNCDGYQNALFALDLLSREKRVVSFAPEGGSFAGSGGTSIGNDGTVYVYVIYAPDATAERHQDTIYALTPKDLKQKNYFTLEDKAINKKDSWAPGITPLVFSYEKRDLVLAGGRDGRLYILDSRSLGGADHHTPLFASGPFARPAKNYDGTGFRGAFSSWVDVDTNTRWFYAPVYGPLSRSAKSSSARIGPVSGSVVAFKLAGEDAQPALLPVWLSREIVSPAPVVIANGMVFVLSTGESSRHSKKDGSAYGISEFQRMASPATLYALDAMTGKELYSSGDAVTTDSYSGGLAVANGRVYFTTRDNAVYCFGLLNGQSQLREQ
ncbi:MAG: hypothetical protein M3Y24_12125 [Acidobacteriota bacterium]|nr:hypothetical protein [Acidobacteriota bacterium]